MGVLERQLAGVTVVQTDSQRHVASIGSALVLAHAAVAQRGEVHVAEGVAELAKVLDFADFDVHICLVLGLGGRWLLGADRDSAASGGVEIVCHGFLQWLRLIQLRKW